MKTCKNCGKKIKTKSNYCPCCGAKQKKGMWKKLIICFAILCIGITAFLLKNSVRMRHNEPISTVADSEINCAYIADPDNFAVDEQSGIAYVNNILLVFFNEKATPEQKKEIVHEVEGTVVGQFDMIDQYQIRIEEHSLNELRALCEELEKKEYIDFVTYDLVAELENSTITMPDDKWNEGWFQSWFEDLFGVEIWSEKNPSGNNWWLEAIQAPSAWNYQDKFTNIKIGIVDNGFDTGHEDLQLTVLNKKFNKKLEHGTHVAGIAGATANNGKGISGVLWNKELICYAWDQYNKDVTGMSATSIIVGLLETVEHGGKVINFSEGVDKVEDKQLLTHEENWSQEQIDSWGENMSTYMSSLLSRNFDFLVVQSAGNGAADKIGVDAKNNGLFASITSDNCVEINSVSKEEILDRIIIVGACQKPDDEGNYMLTSFSNYGEQVDIVAPGEDIYSTIPGGLWGTYGEKDGTSMAAPMVTGVAGMVWSLNEEWDGPTVKKIVCENYDKTVKENPAAALDGREGKTYPLLNAKLAVEAALKKMESDSAASVSETETVTAERDADALDSELADASAETNDAYVFEVLPSSFSLDSGMGSWHSSFDLNVDGTFAGTYFDLNMGETGTGYSNGTVYICSYEGKFSVPEQFDEYRYVMKLEYLNIQDPIGTVYYEDDARYICSDAYGFDDADEFIIYLPGCPITNIAEEFVSWLTWRLPLEGDILPDGYYGIYNSNAGIGFIGMNKGEESNTEEQYEISEEEAYQKVKDYWLGKGNLAMPGGLECTETEEGYEFWGFYDGGDHAATNFRIFVTKDEGRMYDMIWDREITD